VASSGDPKRIKSDFALLAPPEEGLGVRNIQISKWTRSIQ